MIGTNDAKGDVSFDKKFEYTGSALDKAVKDGYAMRTEMDGQLCLDAELHCLRGYFRIWTA